MHKFFCNFNNITQKYELSLSKPNIFNVKINSDEETSLMQEIRNDIQNLYELTTQIKEIITNDEDLNIVNETELLISNLFYSFFASPLELPEEDKKIELKELLTKAIEEANNLEKLINIPEYNRLAGIIRNNFQILLNKLVEPKPQNT